MTCILIAVFSHSMGAMLAFELTKSLQSQYGLSPTHLFLSGAAHPLVSNIIVIHLNITHSLQSLSSLSLLTLLGDIFPSCQTESSLRLSNPWVELQNKSWMMTPWCTSSCRCLEVTSLSLIIYGEHCPGQEGMPLWVCGNACMMATHAVSKAQQSTCLKMRTFWNEQLPLKVWFGDDWLVPFHGGQAGAVCYEIATCCEGMQGKGEMREEMSSTSNVYIGSRLNVQCIRMGCVSSLVWIGPNVISMHIKCLHYIVHSSTSLCPLESLNVLLSWPSTLSIKDGQAVTHIIRVSVLNSCPHAHACSLLFPSRTLCIWPSVAFLTLPHTVVHQESFVSLAFAIVYNRYVYTCIWE